VHVVRKAEHLTHHLHVFPVLRRANRGYAALERDGMRLALGSPSPRAETKERRFNGT
jgi:hypothetical protein